MNILIVEDELLIAKVYAMHFQKAGFHVSGIAADEQQALGLFLQQIPDVVLLDVQLKNKGDGIYLGKLFREKFSGPIIFTTGNALQRTREATAEIDNCYVFSKPVDIHELIRVICKLKAE